MHVVAACQPYYTVQKTYKSQLSQTQGVTLCVTERHGYML